MIKKLSIVLVVGLGLVSAFFAFFALMSLAGCVHGGPAGETKCIGSKIYVSDGQWLQDSGYDCAATVPPTRCVQPDAGAAFCKVVTP